jgi:hypothetical protein
MVSAGIGAQRRDPFAHLLGMQERFIGLGTQAGHDRYAAKAKDEKGIVRVMHHARQFGLQQSIQHGDDGLTSSFVMIAS